MCTGGVRVDKTYIGGGVDKTYIGGCPRRMQQRARDFTNPLVREEDMCISQQ